MHDIDIRRALDACLRSKHADDVIIRHEMGLAAGSRRVDVAVIGDEIAGYEIKSAQDTLSRLAGQSDAYNRVLDRVTLVTAPRHLQSASRILPRWWGLVVAEGDGEEPTFTRIRPSRRNRKPDAVATAQLLWRDEALDELRKRGLARGLSKKARYYIWQALAEGLALEDLRDAVRARLRARPEWPEPRVHRTLACR